MVKSSWRKPNHADCSHKRQVGGVMSMCPLKKSLCDLDCDCGVDKYSPKPKSGLGNFKEGVIDVGGFLSLIVDDGTPFRNEYLMKIDVATEKLENKKRDLLQNYKEDKYKEFVNELKEASDDIFDSRGEDISEKDFLENEMNQDY